MVGVVHVKGGSLYGAVCLKKRLDGAVEEDQNRITGWADRHLMPTTARAWRNGEKREEKKRKEKLNEL